ncbi:FYVE zinc finger-domain-containing protein [Pilobolus umbonatus]|nr:FYVE zinc finger-domain-containing protein [Pilobolus umbonatus]
MDKDTGAEYVRLLSCSSTPTVVITKMIAEPQLSMTAEDDTCTYQSDCKTVINPNTWESDNLVSDCRRCSRSFNFLVRRHHCRRCGQVICDKCSSHRLRLPMEEIIQDPLTHSRLESIANYPQRVCDNCINAPISKHVTADNCSLKSVLVSCPICGIDLTRMRKTESEDHLSQCLIATNQDRYNSQYEIYSTPIRYIVYRLSRRYRTEHECTICFVELKEGDKVARLICLCLYHVNCLRDWLKRGKGCPVHHV